MIRKIIGIFMLLIVTFIPLSRASESVSECNIFEITDAKILILGNPTGASFAGEGIIGCLFLFTPIYVDINFTLSFEWKSSYESAKIFINEEKQILTEPVNITVTGFYGFGLPKAYFLFGIMQSEIYIGTGNIIITSID